MRVFDELPCGCLVSEDGGGALSPCCYPEVGQEESELHKQCMHRYFDEHKTVEEIRNELGAKTQESKYLCDQDCEAPCTFAPKDSKACLDWQTELKKGAKSQEVQE